MTPKTIFIALRFLLLLMGHSLMAQYDFSTVEREMENQSKKIGKNAVMLIYKDGGLVYKKETGDFTLKTKQPIASCSKWLTASLVMTFVDQGTVSLEDKVSTYLPMFKTNGKENITLRDCLSQQTGIHQDPIKIYKLMTQKKFPTLEAEVNDFAQNRKQDYQNGTAFFYGNVGLNIAARVLEVVSKKDFSTLMQTRILQPLEMYNTRFDNGKAAPNPSGSAISTPEDYMNFLTMLLNKGTFKGKRVLSEKAIETIEKRQTSLDKINFAPRMAKGFNYASGCWIQETNSKGNPNVWSCPGLFGTWPLIDTERGYACLFFVKSILNEQKTEAYLAIKNTIDKIILSKNN